MKNKALKILPLILALVICLAGLVAMTSCDGGNKVSEIYVSNSNAPRLNYVEGQELDLTDGILTVVVGGEEQKLPLNSEEVSVTGYDKTKLGEQTLTVAYGEFTTTITVTVIPRMTVEGYEQSYFKGDLFNKDAGKVKIANENANGFTTINMSDSRIIISGFNSETVGTCAVTASYTTGGVTYSSTFNVTIYDHSNVEFTPPSITSYYTHDTSGLNVAKGSFSVTSSDGKLKKNVKLTADMVEGFDLGSVTIADRNKPVKKTLTVKYLDKVFYYDITITYSDISAIEHYASTVLNGINWSSNTDLSLIMTEEQKAAALDVIESYYKLDKVDRKLISKDATKAVALAGSVAAMDLFTKELATYAGTFEYKSTSADNTEKKIYVTAKNYETVIADAEKLSDSKAKLHEIAAILRSADEDFAEYEFTSDYCVSDYIVVYQKEAEEFLVKLINHLLEVYEPLKDVPDNWTNDDLGAYGDAILSTAIKIGNEKYYAQGNGSYYTGVLSKWRANDDFFEIIYSYLLYVHEDGANVIQTTLLGKAPLISKLETWYKTLKNIVEYETYYKNYGTTTAGLADISPLMFLYYTTIEQIKDIKENGTQLEKDLFESFDGDYVARYYTYTYDYGFLFHAKGLIDSKNYNEIWGRYFEVLKLYNKDELSATEHREKLTGMLNVFQNMSPAELFGFLCSLNVSYGNVNHSETPILILDISDDVQYNFFAEILKDYVSTYLSDAAKPVFNKLLVAMENYALLANKKNALDEFKTLMGEAIAAYSKLSANEQSEFDALFGTAYNKYLGIYKLATGETAYTPEGADLEAINELVSSVSRFLDVYGYMADLTNIPAKYYGILYVLYADVMNDYYRLISTASAEALAYAFYHSYEFKGVTCPLEIAFMNIDNAVTNTLNSKSASLSANGDIIHVTAWELFSGFELNDLLVKMADLVYYGYAPDAVTITKSTIDDISATLWALTDFQRSILGFIGIDEPYYDALKAYYASVLTESGSEAANKLLDAEQAYRNASDEAKATFITVMEELSTSYSALSDSDKALLDAMYNKYMAVYEGLMAEEGTEE